MLSAFYRFLGLISSTDKVASKREKSYVCALCRDFFLPSYFCCRTRFVEHGEQGGGAAHQFHLMKILLVDEEPGVILALQAAIENATSHTVRGSTGDLAIAAAEEMGGIDLLIAEAVMQPVDGFTLSLSLGRRFPALQTLFITGFDLDGFDHIVHGRKLLLKPLNPAEVLQAIAELQIAPPATILSLATSAAGSKGEDSLEGRIIGPYRVGIRIRDGKWGGVWSAVRVASGRSVALEILEPWNNPDPVRKGKFIAEATAKARIRYPSMIACYGSEETGGFTHSASEQTGGVTLQEIAAQGKTIEESAALRVLRVIAEVLSHLSSTATRRTLLEAADVLIRPDGQPILGNIIASEGEAPPIHAEMRALAGIARPVTREPSAALREFFQRTEQQGRGGFGTWEAVLKNIRLLEEKAALKLPASPATDRQPEQQKFSERSPINAAPVEKLPASSEVASKLAPEGSLIASVEAPIPQAEAATKPRTSISLAVPARVASIWRKRRSWILPATAGLASILALVLLEQSVNKRAPADVMVEIPAGEFIYQDKEKLNLPTFWIDRCEVTIGQYAEFLESLSKQPTVAFDYPSQPRGKTSHEPRNWQTLYKAAKEHGRLESTPIGLNSPVFLVDWYDAYAYAKWKSRRLPTEMEWEKAARGPNGFLYPWGNVFDPKNCNSGADYSDDPKAKGSVDGYNRWSPVAAIQADRSVYGVIGMAGNVSEWTGSYDAVAKLPVVRGGSYHAPVVSLVARSMMAPGEASEYVGFRTVTDTRPLPRESLFSGVTARLARSPQVDEADARHHEQRGASEYTNGDIHRSVADFNAAAQLSPANAQIYAGRGLARADAGDVDGALADLNRAVELDPAQAVTYNSRGLVRDAAGDWQGAIAEFSKAIELNPGYADALNGRGNARQSAGDLAGAVADYNQALKLNPGFATVYSNRGAAEQAMHQLDSAIADYDRAVAMNPKNARAYMNRGNAKRDKGDLSGALADFDRAIEIDPREVEAAYGSRGIIKSASGDLTGALSDFDHAIALNPKDPKTFRNRGNTRFLRGDATGAISDYTQAINLNPKSDANYDSRGRAEFTVGKLEDAISDFGKAIAINAKEAQYFYHRGLAKDAEHGTDDPLPDYDRAIALNSKYTEAFVSRGIVKLIKRDLDGALSDFNTLIDLDSNNANAYFFRGTAKAAQGDLIGAVAAYSHAIEINPKHADAYFLRGNARAGRRDFSGAIEDFNHAIEINPQSPAVFRQRASVELTQGDRPRAIDDFRRALELNPRDDEAKAELKALDDSPSSPASTPAPTASAR